MKHFIAVLVVLCCFSSILHAQELYSLGATALSRDDANDLDKSYEEMVPLPTSANFEGGMSINGSDFKNEGTFASEGMAETYAFTPSTSDTVEILFRIFPDPLHIGQEADIAVTVAYVDFNTVLMSTLMGAPPSDLAENVKFFMLDSDHNILLLPRPFGGQHLVPLRKMILQSSQDIPLYKGRLAEGFLMINCYYRLPDGYILVNSRPLSILVLPSDLSLLSGFLG